MSTLDEFPSLWEPLQARVRGLEGLERAERCRRVEPRALGDALWTGVLALRRAHSYMSAPTVGKLTTWANWARDAILQQQELWARLDDHVRNGTWNAFKAGADSDETEIGSFIGSMFGEMGSIIGAALGGAAAAERIQAEVEAAERQFWAAVSHWGDDIEAAFDANVAPSIRADHERGSAIGVHSGGHSSRVPWLVALVVVGICSGAGAYLAVQRTRSPSGPAAAIVQAAPPQAPTTSWTDVVVGEWTTRIGDRLELVRDGDMVRANLVTAAHGYAAGDTWFTLRQTTELGVYDVFQHLRPDLEPGEAFAPASVDTCERLVHTNEDGSLRARFDRTAVLRVELLRVRVNPKHLKKRGKTVQRCTDLERNSTARVELVLERLAEAP